jgi:hypothetical protein
MIRLESGHDLLGFDAQLYIGASIASRVAMLSSMWRKEHHRAPPALIVAANA